MKLRLLIVITLVFAVTNIVNAAAPVKASEVEKKLSEIKDFFKANPNERETILQLLSDNELKAELEKRKLNAEREQHKLAGYWVGEIVSDVLKVTDSYASFASTSWTLAFSPDGTKLAAGYDNSAIRLWNVQTEQEIGLFSNPRIGYSPFGHSNNVMSVKFSPNGSQLASGSLDTNIILWDITNGKEIARLKKAGEIDSVAYSPDGTQIAEGLTNNDIILRNAITGKEINILKGHTELVRSVAYSPDGTKLVSGSSDKTVRLWDVKTGQELKVFKGHTAIIWSVAYSFDGNTLASGSGDKTIRLWDIRSGKQIAVLEGHTTWVTAVAFSPDGKKLASGSNDVRLWYPIH